MGIGVAATIAPLLFFKYYGFFTRQRDEHGRGARPAAEPAADPGRAADRASRSTRSWRSATSSTSTTGGSRSRRGSTSSLYLSFFPHLVAGPIVRPEELIPQLDVRRDARHVDVVGRRLADPGRSVQEGRDRQLPGDRDRRSGLQRARATRMAGDPRRHRRLRGADLLRLQRLHRHRDRDREAARVPVPPELRPSLQRPLDPGVLAALAHDAVALAARLPLHPARWEPEGHRAHLREPDDHDAARRVCGTARRGTSWSGAACTGSIW